MTVADTDVLIDFLAGVQPVASKVAEELQTGKLHTTVITRFELLSGARNTKQESKIKDLLTAIPALPLDEQSADQAAGVRRKLERLGATIGMADSLIAGIVLLQDGILLTRNRRHFDRVHGLRLMNVESAG